MAGHDELFPVGSTFSPQDHELINQFLRQKIAGADRGRFSSFIHEDDVYSAPPGDLIENRAHAPGSDKDDGKGGVWYFFSPVRRHKTKGGRSGRRQRVGDDDEGYNWHSENSKPVLDTQGKRVGLIDHLSFGIKRPGAARTRVGWCMKEYGLDHDDDGAGSTTHWAAEASGADAATAAASAAISSASAPSCERRRRRSTRSGWSSATTSSRDSSSPRSNDAWLDLKEEGVRRLPQLVPALEGLRRMLQPDPAGPVLRLPSHCGNKSQAMSFSLS